MAMDEASKRLLGLLLLTHAAGVAHGHAHAMQTMKGGQQQSQPKVGPPPKPKMEAKPKQNPKAQGSKGKAQGRHGVKGPNGGTKALQNAAGTLPNQNPMNAALKAYGNK